MGLMNRIFGVEEARASALPLRDPALAEMFGGGMHTASGELVTPDSAMKVTAVWACVSLLAETVASLPLCVYQIRDDNTAGKVRTKAKDHALYPVLTAQANDALTSFELIEFLVTHTALRGDSLALIKTDGGGDVVGIKPLDPKRSRIYKATDNRIRYEYVSEDNRTHTYLDGEVLRIPYKMLNGWESVTPIQVHRETVGISVAAQKTLASFYKNQASPKGGLKLPTAIDDEAAKILRDAWERRHQGTHNAGKIAIFDGGMEWQEIGMNMQDAQYVELQNLSVVDIARIYLIPPHKIGELSKATFSNIEHQAIEFVTGTLSRWCKRIEQRMNAYLLTPNERAAGYYISFDLKGAMRGDAKSRALLYRTLFMVGAMSPNEIREEEGFNPYDGGDGFFMQGANVPINDIGSDPLDKDDGDDEEES